MNYLSNPIKICFLFLILACTGSHEAINDKQGNSINLINAFPALSFERPVDLQNSKDGTNRIFVVEQKGRVLVFDNKSSMNNYKVFFDIQDLVDDRSNEEGLLGLTFHPDYKNNGHFFVYYTARPNKTIISRYKVSDSDINKADKNSELILLDFKQPYGNHNGGQIAFGPDNYLYASLGDGGSAGDPKGNGQNKSSILGSIIRIDADNKSANLNYSIPSDNPFNGLTGHSPEIYAYGLRNTWRFSFDSETGNLFAADVGQNDIEEIDLIEKGKNYGWNTMEGSNCYRPSSGCNKAGLTMPIWEYNHYQGDKSITGGYVYRGSSVTELKGKYIYGDFVSGRIWALDISNLNDPNNELIIESNLNVASFGIDENKEIYICAFDGKIYKFSTN